MSGPPAYKDSIACPSVPPAGPGYEGIPQQPPYPVNVNPPYPSSSVYPQPAQPVPPYPTYGSSNVGYNQGYGGSSYASNPMPAHASDSEAALYGVEQGRSDDPSTAWIGTSFSDKKIRQQFIKKVYLLLMSQLLFTFGVVCLFFFSESVKLWVRSNQWFYWCSYAVFLITYITLVCCDGVRRSWPANIICLAIFTMAFSYMAGTISSFYDTQSVLVAVGITAAVCLSVSLFAIQTRIDFTMCSGLIFAFCMVFIFFGFACLITYLATGPSYAHYVMHCVYGGLAAGLFSLFLVFDTQMVIGGHKRRYQLSPEEYIYGALQLYVDVVNLFIIMLGLFGNRN